MTNDNESSPRVGREIPLGLCIYCGFETAYGAEDAAAQIIDHHRVCPKNPWRAALAELVRQIDEFTATEGEANFYTGDAMRLLGDERMLGIVEPEAASNERVTAEAEAAMRPSVEEHEEFWRERDDDPVYVSVPRSCTRELARAGCQHFKGYQPICEANVRLLIEDVATAWEDMVALVASGFGGVPVRASAPVVPRHGIAPRLVAPEKCQACGAPKGNDHAIGCYTGQLERDLAGSAPKIPMPGLLTIRLGEALERVAPYFEGEHHPDHPACRAIRHALSDYEKWRDDGEVNAMRADAEELANALRDVLAGHPVRNADELIARYSSLSDVS